MTPTQRSGPADGGRVDIVLIVISYRSAADVAGLLETVPGAAGHLSWRAVIVNNDPSEPLAPLLPAREGVQVVEAGSNLGYAGGINLALTVAPPSRWTVFLNPDLRLGAGALTTLARVCGSRSAAVPAIYHAGRRQPSLRREPSVLGSLGEAVLGDHWASRPAVLTEVIRPSASYHRGGRVDWATGAAIMAPTDVVHRVGPWDADTFFLYSEETDYCRRLRRAGHDIRFAPEAEADHRGAGSGTSDALHALLEVNRIRYFRKWHGPAATAIFTGTVLLHNVLRARRPRSRAALRALLSPRARAGLPGGPR